jgi:mannose-6-phosphate isomerase-like protein (cupin superfamily)
LPAQQCSWHWLLYGHGAILAAGPSTIEERPLVKKLVGSSRQLLPILRQEIVSYDRYEAAQLKVIGFPGFPSTDVIVKDFMNYAEWVATHQQYPIIKVEGLETVIPIADTVHLFYNQRSQYSFNWHTDLVDVYLHVVKGRKTLQVQDRTYKLVAGIGARIPKGQLHRAFSVNDTWALSFGLTS